MRIYPNDFAVDGPTFLQGSHRAELEPFRSSSDDVHAAAVVRWSLDEE